MNIRNFLGVLLIILVLFSCTNDDDGTTGPVLQLSNEQSVKPDSTLIIEVTAMAPGLLAADGITGEVINGEGTLNRTSFQGENMNSGMASFEFTAGSTENSTSLLRFSALDQSGQTGTEEIEVTITSLEIKQVMVLNEGNFFSANGTLDLYDIRDQSVDNLVFEAMATVQQAVMHDGAIYMVTNAPDQLLVLDDQFNQQAAISEGFDNPIDVAAIDGIAYVSNWGDINTAFTNDPDSYVALVDLTSNEVVDSVLLDARPHGILAHQGKLFVALEGGSSVTVVDPLDHSVTDITMASGPSEFVVDGLGMIWTLCTSGALVEIDPESLTVETTIDGLTTGGFSEKLAINGEGSMVYFLGGTNGSFTGLTTVYSVDLVTQQVTPLIENGFALYGIGVNPESDEIYLGDSNAFQSTGTGFRYDAQGNLLNQFATGIGPNGFLFIIELN